MFGVANSPSKSPRGTSNLQSVENAIGPSWEWEINLSTHFNPPYLLEIRNGLESADKEMKEILKYWYVLRFSMFNVYNK